MSGFLAIFLSVPVVAAWLLAFPLGSAYLEGIRSARDPSHRLTPRDPWFFFDRRVAARLRLWRWIWAGSYGLGLALPALLVFVDPNFWANGLTIETFGICVMYADVGLSTGLLIYTGLLLLAPRFEELRWLMVACLVISLFVLSPILFAASIVFLRAFSNSHPEALRIFTFGFALFPVQILVLALALRFWARARGDHWFRIEASSPGTSKRTEAFAPRRPLGKLPSIH